MPTSQSQPSEPTTDVPAIEPVKSVSHLAGAIIFFVFVLLAILVTWVFPMEQYPKLYPPCAFYQNTGMQCSGCGATRAVSAVAHGDFKRAFSSNAMFMVALPFIVWWFVHCTVYGLTGRALWPAIRLRWYLLIPVLVVVFSIVRNLPYWPFTLLVPPPV